MSPEKFKSRGKEQPSWDHMRELRRKREQQKREEKLNKKAQRGEMKIRKGSR